MFWVGVWIGVKASEIRCTSDDENFSSIYFFLSLTYFTPYSHVNHGKMMNLIGLDFMQFSIINLHSLG